MLRSISTEAPPAIGIRGVTRRFGAVVAVDNFSLVVGRGEIFALTGPDGAGKTTLIRLICGALALDEGSLSVDGVDVVAQTARVQGAIGYMPQHFSLYPDLSLMENLAFYGEIFGVPAREFGARARSLLTEFSLWEFRTRLAEELSGGMKQKLALACTLVHRPATILLDEPTAGVDPVSRRELWRILYRINRGGTTIFLSTPYMDEAELSDRVALMIRGSLVQCGTPDAIKQAIDGEVVEIVCRDRAGARRVLAALPDVRSVEIFGETLHALVRSAESAIPKISGALAEAGVADARLTRIRPTVEDAFVARLTA